MRLLALAAHCGRWLSGDVGEHALVARGRLGWRDGMPELRNPSPIDQTPGAALEFADTDTGRELAASNC